MRDRLVYRVFLPVCHGICYMIGLSGLLIVQARNPAPRQFRFPDRHQNQETSRITNYAGPAICAECHSSEASSQKATPMAHAATLASESEILRSHRRLSVHIGPYSYQITTEGDRSIYTVGDGTRTISEPVLWAFGRGEAGQTYLFQHNGAYYQSRVSFFDDTQSLDLTLGAPPLLTPSLDEAMGNLLTPDEARLCFRCHTTPAATGQLLEVNQLPGVTCEACHGPGARHVTAMRAGNLQTSFIFNPARLNAGGLTDFCGSCHRTRQQVEAMKVVGVENVRFQPYRLQSSNCWDSEDARIICISCHDPHQQRRTDPAFYDSKCTACHASRRGVKSITHPGRACPVSSSDCVTCHMPKYALPGGHFKFTDHMIRVVRPGEKYPN